MQDILYKNSLPLKIVHNWKSADRSFDQNKDYITAKLLELREMGFGGVVTNVHHGKVCDAPTPGEYLNNEEDWALFRFTLDELDRLGMRAWIYDEHGYPSGGAGGLTLREHPEYECRAIAKLTEGLEPGESKTVSLPRGHKALLYGASYPCSRAWMPTSLTPVEEFVCNGCETDLTFTNRTEEKQLICVFVDKHLYEGTHAEHNVCECRRYLDLMNRDAVREFIRNTYEPYTANAKQHYIGGTGLVEAYFTDEPSLMGCYINEGLYPPRVHDQYDDTLPLYPIINFGRDVENTFEALSGLDFRKNLIYLFYGETDYAKRVRYFFHLTTTKLYEESFFEQLANYCAAQGTRFSGHILLEDDIRHHMIFEGNYFSFLRHMHIPGIDMLHSLPELVRRDMFTPKLISSIGHGYGRKHAMSEVSAHAQGGKVTGEQMYASMALQFAFGIDIFTSYYSETLVDKVSYARYNNAIGRFSALLGNGAHKADVLLYYPIETFMMNHHSKDGNCYWGFTDAENACRDGLYGLMYELCDAQVDFDLADLDVVKSLLVQNGKICGRMGEEYKYLVLPPMELTPEMQGVFAALERRGVKICAMQDACFPDLNAAPFGKKFSTASALVTSFDRYEEGFAIDLDAPHRGVACLPKEIDGRMHYLFVNSTAEPIALELAVKTPEPILYDPLRDCTLPMGTEADRAGTRCRFELNGYGVLVIR